MICVLALAVPWKVSFMRINKLPSWKEAESQWDKHPSQTKMVHDLRAAYPYLVERDQSREAGKEASWRRLFAQPTIAGIEEVLDYYPSEQRGDAILYIFKNINCGELFWPVIAKQWFGFDAINHSEFNEEFLKRRQTWKPTCMEADDRAAYETLPEKFTIYHGQDASRHSLSTSWTLDRKVAEGFAKGHRGIYNRSPRVLTATAEKENVALYLNGRSESEVVLFRPPKIEQQVDIPPTIVEPFSKSKFIARYEALKKQRKPALD
jgi:hypothetical protein